MTENLLQKLEEKMMALLSELEEARRDIQRLAQENSLLRAEREQHAYKLNDLISLLDAATAPDNMMMNASIQVMKPVLVQG